MNCQSHTRVTAPYCGLAKSWASTVLARFPSAHFVFILFFTLLLSSCSSTRPILKIGLLAPFEGLHRESGYNALAAMRSALNDYPLDGVDVLPLALDTSASPSQARRAAVKMLRDNSVVAVVGPLQTKEVSAVADIMAASNLDWQLPAIPASQEEAIVFIEALIIEIDGQNIALAGLDDGWPRLSPSEWSSATGKMVTAGSDESEAAKADGVLWLGDAPGGAAFLARLRARNHTVPFWTTTVAADKVFSSLVQDYLAGDPPGPVYWAAQLDENPSLHARWADRNAQDAPAEFAVYLATRKALTNLAGQPDHSNNAGLAVFTFNNEGSSHLARFVPLHPSQ